jgi:hypothetical protein
MVVEIAAGKVIARPRQQLVKRFAIVRRQGKEQGVALPFEVVILRVSLGSMTRPPSLM